MAGEPWRDDSGTTRPPAALACPVCGRPFAPVGRQRHCSTICRKRAFRRRRAAALTAALPVGASRRDQTIYECGGCGARQLGRQRCGDCGLFGSAVGLGGECPHCGEVVAAGELGLCVEEPR